MMLRRLGVSFLVLGMVITAMATPKHMATFWKTYPTTKDKPVGKAKCVACHVKGKELNDYGKDLQREMQARKTKDLTVEILRAVEKLDSDKDGASNGDELKAGTLPGDPKSKPAS